MNKWLILVSGAVEDVAEHTAEPNAAEDSQAARKRA